MNRRCTGFVIASVLSLAVLLGLAWAANVEEELKKLETDRAAAAVKGDAATLEKQTSDDYTFINLYGQMSDKSQMVNAFKTGQTKLTFKGTLGGKDTNGQIMFTRVYVKKGGSWQSVAFQQTLVSNP